MGCPGGTRSVFTLAENFTVYFSGKRQSLLHPNTARRSFSHYNLFLGKRVNTERVYRIVLMPSGHPTILVKSK